MGRKQRLRRERRSNNNNSKAKNSSSNNNNNNNTKNAGEQKPPPSTTTTTTMPNMAVAADNNEQINGEYNKNEAGDGDDDDDPCRGKKILPLDPCAYDERFPMSECFANIEYRSVINVEFMDILTQGAIEYGCVHSMFAMGRVLVTVFDGRIIHSAHPWLLEGAIRGSYSCIITLVTDIYLKAKSQPVAVAALSAYWWEIDDTIDKWDNGPSSGGTNIASFIKYDTERKCVICSKTDTSTLTLQQCNAVDVVCIVMAVKIVKPLIGRETVIIGLSVSN
jgi:hypothetical protein